MKTKPTQQSVAKLREIGITPHVLVCRCEKPLDKELRQKISMFCNVPARGRHRGKGRGPFHLRSAADAPARTHGRPRLPPAAICTRPRANMAHWQEIIRKLIAPQHRVRVGVVGKYIGLQDAYKSVYEAIIHGGIAQRLRRGNRAGGRRGNRERRRGKNLEGRWAAFWCPADLANAVSKEKFWRRNTPAKIKSLISAFASACKSRRLNLRGMF